MFLDPFKLASLTVQIQYADALEIWDRAGATAKEMSKIWTDLQVLEGQPNQQILSGKNVQIQTGIKLSLATLTNLSSIDRQTIERVAQTFRTWRSELSLEQLSRLSTRALYTRDFESIKEANLALRGLNLVRWPTAKIFDQPEDSETNAPEVAFKFEDSKSFSILRFRTEQLKFRMPPLPPPFEDAAADVGEKTVNRLVVDLDRGLLGIINATQVMMDEWLRGFQHILRRDIEKIVGGSS